MASLPSNFALPPVSILKPLKGTDLLLKNNLKSFFTLQYTSPYELLFSVESDSDPAVKVVQELSLNFPEVSCRLFISDFDSPKRELGKNPKMNNLAHSYLDAKYDCILISDSNVRVDPEYLCEMVRHLDEQTGMVTSIIAGTQALNSSAFLEAITLNSLYARFMALSNRFSKPCVVGKSMLFRKSQAERFGGLKILSCFLAEDFIAGEAMIKLGLKVKTAHQPIPQVIGNYTFKDFLKRHLRWGQIRKKHAPIPFLFEPFSQSIFTHLIAFLALSTLYGNHFFSIFVLISASMVVWGSLDFIQYLKMSRPTQKQFLQFPAFWLFRELLALPIWCGILFQNHVEWKGRRLRLETGGLLVDDQS